MKKYGIRAGRRLEKLRIMSENVSIRPEIMLIVRKKRAPAEAAAGAPGATFCPLRGRKAPPRLHRLKKISIFAHLADNTKTMIKMKKMKLKTTACLLAAALTLSSCIGSFGLFNKVLDWNKGLSNKFVNEIVFILISPAYVVCGAVDLLVLNTVEFWSGTNPVAKVGTVENVWGTDGRQYAVKTLKDGYEVTKPTGEKVLFTYDKKLKSWSMEAEGQERELFRFNDDGTIQATLPDGGKKDLTLDERGVSSLRMAMGDGLYFAAR